MLFVLGRVGLTRVKPVYDNSIAVDHFYPSHTCGSFCYHLLLSCDALCVPSRYHTKKEALSLIRTRPKESLENSVLLKSGLIITLLIINSLLLCCIVACFQWE